MASYKFAVFITAEIVLPIKNHLLPTIPCLVPICCCCINSNTPTFATANAGFFDKQVSKTWNI